MLSSFVFFIIIVNFILQDGNTSLHIATSKGYTKAVSILLNNKANVDAQNLVSILSSFQTCNDIKGFL